MAILYDKQLIFIHIPKSGGTSVHEIMFGNRPLVPREFLGTEVRNLPLSYFVDEADHFRPYPPLNHLPVSRIREVIDREKFESFTKFTLVRNPFDRVLSIYKYWQSRNNLPRSTPFSEFVQMISSRPSFKTKWPNQVFFVNDENGNLLLDEVFKLEEKKKLETFLTARLNKDVVMPHARATKKLSSRQIYGRRSMEQVNQLYKEDFETFDYPQTIAKRVYFSASHAKHRLTLLAHFGRFIFRK
ncbi:MAG: sulfotransferase family 2 domain-containing protein [Vicingaceae bacterium]